MTTMLKELPLMEYKIPADVQENEPDNSFFVFKIFLPENVVFYAEMSDSEVSIAATRSGTFDFLDADGENIYAV